MSPTKITSELVQAVRDASDIVEVASGMTQLEKKGQRYEGLCPFHKEKTPSFSVDPDQGLFYCFGCGVGGDTIKLFMEQSGDDFPAAIEALAGRYGIPLPNRPTGRPSSAEAGISSALEAAAKFFEQGLQHSAFARDYLEKRQISPELQSSYGLGYAPDGWDNLLQALKGRIPLESLIAAGLVGRSQKTGNPYDRFRHRLMFPIHNPSGRLVGFGGRTLGDDRAKYVNTSETEHFHKSNLLYGFHQAKRTLREDGKAVLVEGYFDVLGAVASGVSWAIAGMGTALTEAQARLLARYSDEVTLAYDGDDAGEKAFERALPILLGAGLAVRRASFPRGHDPDSLRVEAGGEAVLECITTAEDAVWLGIRKLIPPAKDLTPVLQARAAKPIAELLNIVRSEVEREAYRRRAAEHLGVPEGALRGRRGAEHYFKAIESSAADVRREVRSEEEKALCLLLQEGAEIPRPAQLPPAEIFLDAECRNIYEAFRDLYGDGESAAPTGSDVVAKLSNAGDAIDRAARLLLQDSDSGGGDLPETLEKLLRRWFKQRQTELMRQIRQAQQQGNSELLIQLLEEKKSLSRSLHPGMTGKLW
ncbi:MAG: DNA primase [Acidobacteriota bacterium]